MQTHSYGGPHINFSQLSYFDQIPSLQRHNIIKNSRNHPI